MPLRPGERFGRYELAEILGRGAMGEVYSAYDTILHRKVALKVLSLPARIGERVPATEGSARVLREARAAAGITHPNAVSVYDFGEEEAVPFLAMELVVGRTLRCFVSDDSVLLARRTRWLADVARALGAAHQLGIVHRDVKPENVMVRDDGLVKVLDFGISRRTSLVTGAAERAPAVGPLLDSDALRALAETNGLLTAEGLVMGTPLYMAPEQMRGEALDGRADQFAWGVLAYELLSGKLPWEGEGLGMLSHILTREVTPLTESSREIPARVDAVIRRALSKERSDRFLTMEEVAEELEPFSSSAHGAIGRLDRAVVLPGELHAILWGDVFVLVDHGEATPADYTRLGETVMGQAAKYPAGIGALVIIPRNVTPPPDDARVAMHALMQRLSDSVRSFCWLIEADGFQRAMVRGVLTGMKMFGRLPYESHVSTDIGEALGWVLRRLDGGDGRVALVPEGVRWIAERRQQLRERPTQRT